MFERFTERARQVVVLAQEEARTLKHNYIGTEHLLLGLVRETDGLAAAVLQSLDISLERVRAHVVRIVGSGEEVTSGQIPFTPRAKKVLELALREALSLGTNHIGTEHILLALVRENEGVAARVLLDFDADPERIRNAVVRAMGGSAPRAEVRVAGTPEMSPRTGGGLNAAWFGGLDGALRQLESALGDQLGRLPDSADLLLALAAAADTRAAATLRRAGVELEALAAAARAEREASGSTQAELAQQIVEVRRDRERAAREQDYETAAVLRDRERELEQHRQSAEPAPGAIDAMRRALGLPENGDG